MRREKRDAGNGVHPARYRGRLNRSAATPLAVREDLVDGFQEEKVAPHHRLVHAQFFVEMIDAVLQDSFPAGRGPGEVSFGAESVENRQRGVAVRAGPAPVRAAR